MIAQLKAENFELKQKERDYSVLNSQLLDLEQRFKMLQEEKARAEREAREREDLLLNKSDLLQTELRRFNDTSVDKQRQIKDTEVELNAYKDLVSEKNAELNKLKDDLAHYAQENDLLTRERRNAEADLDVLREGRKAAQAEVERLRAMNENLMRAQAQAKDKEQDSTQEVLRLRRKLDDISVQLDSVQKDRAQRETEADMAIETRRAKQRELDQVAVINAKLRDENQAFGERVRDLEIDLKRLTQRMDDSMTLLDAKEKELRNLRSSISYTEDRGLSASAELSKLKKENDSLQLLLDKYRNDVEFQKRLREEESLKKMEIEQEKRRLEKEALSKELEARTVKRQLEQVQGSHGQLLDQKLQLNEELEALKQHTGLLQSQNANVRMSVRMKCV